MPKPLRRLFLVACGIVAGLVVVLLVEIQLARSGERLPDEDGSRPQGLVVGADRPGTPVEIVWLGDSTSTGVGADDFVDSMTHRTAVAASTTLDRPVSLTVLGVSGARVEAVAEDQVEGLASVDADVVVVSVGANDVTHLTRRPRFRDRYRALLERVAELAPDAGVVLVGIPDMGSVSRFAQPLRFLAGARAAQLDDDVRSVAPHVGAQYVDLAGETGPRFRSDPGRFFSADGFHPGSDGHGLWGAAVRGEVVTAARRAAG